MSVRFVASTIIKAGDAASAPLSRIQKKMDAVNRSMRQVRKTARGMRDFGARATRSITLPTVAASANALRISNNFQAAMNQTEARLTDASKAQIAMLRKRAKDLGRDTQFSATQAAQGMQFLAQAGLDADKIYSALPGTLNLAAAGAIEVADAADISTNIMSQFGMEFDAAGKNIERMGDVLALAAASTNTDILEMSEAMKQAGPVANAFGLDLEQTAAMVGILANAGIKGSDAGTGLKNMFSKLAAPSKKAADIMAELGIKQSDLFTQMENGQPVFKGASNMMDVFNKSGADAIDILEVLGLRGGPKTLAMFSQGSTAIQDLEQSLNNAHGAAQRMAEIQMQGSVGVFKRFASAFEGMNIALVESGFFDGVFKVMEGITKGMRHMAKHPKLMKAIATGVATLAIIAPIIFTIGAAMLFATAAAAPLAVIFSPIGLIIAGVAAAGLVLFFNFDKLKKVMERYPAIMKLVKVAFFAATLPLRMLKKVLFWIWNNSGLVWDALAKGADFAMKMLDLKIASFLNFPTVFMESLRKVQDFFGRVFDFMALKFDRFQLGVLQGLNRLSLFTNKKFDQAVDNRIAELERGIAQRENRIVSGPPERGKLDITIGGEVKGVKGLNIEAKAKGRAAVGRVGYTNTAMGF